MGTKPQKAAFPAAFQSTTCMFVSVYVFHICLQIVSLFWQAFFLIIIKALFLKFMNGYGTINAAECLKLITQASAQPLLVRNHVI